MQDFFKGLKVIELASVLAGPAVGLFFAELGAEVIKVENKKTGGDVTRRWKTKGESPNNKKSSYYASVNWGKKEVLMDLSEKEDRFQLMEWIKEADVVISNFKRKSAERMQLDYEQVKKIKETIIYAQLDAFGHDNDRPAFDVALQAEAGFLYMCGEPDRKPSKMPVALIDLLAAHQLKEGILLAILKKERTGEGSFVSTSLWEAAIASLANQATNWLIAGHIPQRMGTAHPNIAPYGDSFYTKDKKLILVAAGTEKQFIGLCEALDKTELTRDDRFKDNASRVIHREELYKELSPVFEAHERANIAQKLKLAKVPYGSIRNMQEVFEEVDPDFLLEDFDEQGNRLLRPKTVAFKMV
ncbi:MAG: CoA transferase [Bacteroidota bacterium]